MSKNRDIRLFCLDCCLGNSEEVKYCPCKSCQLHPFRFGTEVMENRDADGRVNRSVAIKRKCKDCEGEAVCDNLDCSLYAYRHEI